MEHKSKTKGRLYMGYLFVLAYVLLVGVSTILMKSTLKTIDPFQLNFLMGIGMLVSGSLALLIANKSFNIPIGELPMGILIGLMMALGSIFFTLAINEMPAGLASVLAATYVAVVIILSWIFLKESMDQIKIAGLAVTFIGVLMLSYKA